MYTCLHIFYLYHIYIFKSPISIVIIITFYNLTSIKAKKVNQIFSEELLKSLFLCTFSNPGEFSEVLLWAQSEGREHFLIWALQELAE